MFYLGTVLNWLTQRGARCTAVNSSAFCKSECSFEARGIAVKMKQSEFARMKHQGVIYFLKFIKEPKLKVFWLNIFYFSFDMLPAFLNGQAVDVPMLAKCSSGKNY